MKVNWKRLLPWIVLAVLLTASISMFVDREREHTPHLSEITYSDFLSQVDDGRIHDVEIAGDTITGHFKENNRAFGTYAPRDPVLMLSLIHI